MQENQPPWDDWGQHPSVQAGPMIPARTTWPVVIGSICTGLGGLGLVCGACGFAMSAVTPHLPQPGGGAPPGAVMTPAAGAIFVVTSVLYVLHITAGIGLLRRRPWAGALCLTWAGLKWVFAIGTTIYTVMTAEETVREIKQQAAQQGTPLPFDLTASLIAGVAIATFLFHIIWPTFLIIWFMRSRIAAEVRSWRAHNQHGFGP